MLRPLGFDAESAELARSALVPLIGLEDEHLATILAVERDPSTGQVFVVSEWIEGVALSEVASSLSRDHVIRVVADALSGLSTLHALFIAHGDVSPANLIVAQDGRGVLVDPSFVEPDHAGRGTLQYLAPERVLSSAPSPAADLYACGATLLHALCGAPPHEGSDPTALVRAILCGFDREAIATRIDDRALAAVVSRVLEVDPALRPIDAASARTMLLEASGAGDAAERAVIPARLVAPLARSTAEHVRQLVIGSGEGRRSRVIVVTSGDAVERAAVIDSFKSTCRLRGWSTLEFERLRDPARAIAELRSIGAPVAFLSQEIGDDTAAASCVMQVVARALALGELEGLLVVCGQLDAVTLRLPHDIAIDLEMMCPAAVDAKDVRAVLERALPTLQQPAALASELVRSAEGSSRRVVDLFREFVAVGGIEVADGGYVTDLSRMAVAEPNVVAAPDLERELDSAAIDEREAVALLSRSSVDLSLEEFADALEWPGPRALAALTALHRRGWLLEFDPPRSTGRLRTHVVMASRARPGTSLVAGTYLRLARRLLRSRHDLAALLSIAELLTAASHRAAGRIARRAAAIALDPRHVEPGSANRAVRLEAAARVPRGALRDHRHRAARALSLSGVLVDAEAAYSEVERLDAAAPHENEANAAVEHAQLLERLGRPREGLARIDRALPRARGADVFRLRAVRAWMLEASGESARGREEGAAIFDLRGAVLDDVASLEIAAVASALFDRAGDRRRARLATVLARRAANRLGRVSRAAHFDSTLAMFDIDAGDLTRALRRLERAVGRLESAGDRRLLPDALTRLGFARLEIGDLRMAFANFQRARILFSRADDSRGLGWALAGEGSTRLRLGDVENAIRCFEESVERRSKVHSEAGAAISAAEQARALAWHGDNAAAETVAKDALLRTRAEPKGLARLRILLVIAESARDRGAAALARGAARRALLLAYRVGSAADRALAETLVAEIEASRGGEVGALRRVRSARRVARRAGAISVLAEADGVRAAVFALLKRPRSARRAFAAAQRRASDPGVRASIGIAFARAVRLALSRGSGILLREARDAARDAHRAALAVGHRPRTIAARELTAALDAALEGPLVHRDLEHENRRLRQVLEASRWINEAGSVSEVLGRILDSTLELTGSSRGFVVTGEAGAVRFEAARNLRQQDIERPEMMLSRSIVDRVLREGQTIVTSEARTDERFREYRSISRLELLSVMCAPLRLRRGVIGAIYVDDPERVDRFDDSARAVVEAFAEHAAIALDQARLRADVEALNERLASDVRDRTRELVATRRDLDAARRDLAARELRIVTQDPRLLAMLDLVERVADSDAPVLILGEAGTGKELVARELHDRSHRRRKPFVAVNSASLAESLVEAELFGYRKGAFTGATKDHEGLIVAASEGSLFLDEIADMPLAVQAKLLRVLQDGEVLPVGATKPIRVHFRLIAATNRPLKKWVDEGKFRDDLYWRLRVLEITIPPLRDRRGDIPLLVAHFAAAYARRSGHDVRRFSAAAIERLSTAPFPGNVRELQSVVQAAVLTAPADPIDVSDLPAEYRSADLPAAPLPDESVAMKDAIADYEKRMIARALLATGGNRVHAAKRLGITRRWLLTLIERYGLD